MKKFIIAASCGLLLAACGTNGSNDTETAGLTACECAEMTNQKDKDLEQLNKCVELRKDEAFQKEYTKCVAAMITGKSPDQVNLVSGDEATIKLPNDATYTANSGTVSWTGKKITGAAHNGEVNVQEGSITVINGQISAAKIVMDMSSISNKDLDEESAAKLLGHLKSADFFNVEEFATATFELVSAEYIDNKMTATGNLTIKGITKPATAKIIYSANGEDGIVITGTMMIDRTEFDIRYGSDKFFDNLGDNVIKDQIMMKINMKAVAVQEGA
ncbi:MAG: YceI family protein [Flavobacteriales bacterium]|nr:YceI family protein [Flavobacteriales bacterium]